MDQDLDIAYSSPQTVLRQSSGSPQLFQSCFFSFLKIGNSDFSQFYTASPNTKNAVSIREWLLSINNLVRVFLFKEYI